MNQFRKSILLASIFLLFPLSSIADQNEPLTSTQAAAKLEVIQKKIEVAQKALAVLKTDYSRQEKKLGKINNQLSDTKKDVISLETEITSLKASLLTITDEIERQKTIIDKQQEWLKSDLRSAYQSGSPSKLALIMGQKDPTSAARMAVYAEYLNDARQSKIEALQAHEKRLEHLQGQTETEKETLSVKVDTLKKKSEEYQKLKRKQNKVLAKIKQKMNKSRNNIQGFEKDKAHLDRLMNELIALESVASNLEQKPFQQLKGKLSPPVDGKVAQLFGRTRQSTGTKWKGIWFKTRPGEAVHAIHHGQIIFSEWLRGYGLLVILDHGNNYYTLYGHNESLLKKPGEWVMSGDPIAINGGSITSKQGSSGQSGLYFEIRQNGQAVNPSNWLAKSAKLP